jgi:predicted ribosomally synthesized peptide with nif11-like leader
MWSVLLAMAVALCEVVLRSAEGSFGWCQAEAHTPLGAMSEKQLKAFLEAVKADVGLQEQLKAAGDADAIVAIAKAAGFVISAEELKRAQAEISEDKLEGVVGSGGEMGTCAFGTTATQKAACSKP